MSNSQFENGLTLVDRLGVNEGSSVLDIGCGTGRLAAHVAKIIGPSGKIAGIDPSPLRIELASKKIKDTSSTRSNFCVGRAEDLSVFIDNTFDIAYLCAVFHWVADKKAALKEIHRILRPGGKVGLTTGDKDTPFTVRQISDKVLNSGPYAGQVNHEEDTNKPVNRNELQALFQSAGYEDINITTRTTQIYFNTTKEVFEFIESSSFGTFLQHVPVHLRLSAKHDIEKELEKRRTSEGIELLSNTVFAIAQKKS